MIRNRPHTIDSFFQCTKPAKNGCLNWTGPIKTSGYGSVGYYNRCIPAQRLSWILTIGEIPKGLLVCHSCDNKKCVNPNHLFLGTYKDNTEDMISKGRGGNAGAKRKKVCKRGHRYTKSNTRFNKKGHKSCKACEHYRYLSKL